jgi:hypothetical protein
MVIVLVVFVIVTMDIMVLIVLKLFVLLDNTMFLLIIHVVLPALQDIIPINFQAPAKHANHHVPNALILPPTV